MTVQVHIYVLIVFLIRLMIIHNIIVEVSSSPRFSPVLQVNLRSWMQWFHQCLRSLSPLA